MRRHKLGKKHSRKIFHKGTKIRKKNLRAVPMRGGFRI